MKRVLIATSCLTLVLLPALSLAQANPQQGGKSDQSRQSHPGHQGGAGAKPGNPGVGGGNRPVTRVPGVGGANRPSPGGLGMAGPNRPGTSAPGMVRPGRPAQPVLGNRPGRPSNPGNAGNRTPAWSRGHWGWNGQRYRAGGFTYPSGYGYQRWSIGQMLPLLFLSSAYYFTDYAALGIEAPPWGYQWVRYGPDLVLVNVRTGQIMDVEYGVFY